MKGFGVERLIEKKRGGVTGVGECLICPITEKCGMINAYLKNKGRLPPKQTFCPLEFTAERAAENAFKEERRKWSA